MKTKTAKRIQKTRIAVQLIFTLTFFWLLFSAASAGGEASHSADYFFYFDPFVLLMYFLSTFKTRPELLLSLIPLLLTFFMGRFFCGWACPFGAMNQFFTWLFRKSKLQKKEVDRRFLKIKYFVLIALIISTLWGMNAGGWLDPFSLLTRSTGLFIAPGANFALETALKEGAQDEGLAAKTLKPIYNFSKKHLLTNKQRGFSQTALIGGLLVFLLVMNLYRRRFFCNYLCPLGAIYGLAARSAALNLKTNDHCIQCNACARHCTYQGSPYKDYMKSECLLCYNCAGDCPKDAVDTLIAIPKKENRTVIDLRRRQIMGSLAAGLTFAIIPGANAQSRYKIHPFTRPPGSKPEKEFLDMCIRCGACMSVCPTGFIQPALLESGVKGLWTPVLNPQTGYCDYKCNKCTQVCPTHAISTLTLQEKQKFKVGTAVIDRNRCYTYADGYNCAVCEEHCPVPDKAIRFRDVPTWNLDGQQVTVKQIYVVPDQCIGCGVCQNVCPRQDAPGILLSAEEEKREELSY